MHEFSICRGIIASIRSEMARLEKPESSLRTACVAIGDVHQVVPDTLTFAYESMTKDSDLAGSKLDLRFVPVRIKCRNCGWVGETDRNMFICGKCNSSNVDVLDGMEMILERLKIETTKDTDAN